MGYSALQSLSNRLPLPTDPKIAASGLSNSPAAAQQSTQTVPAPNSADSFVPLSDGGGDELSVAMYYAQMQRVSLSFQVQQMQAFGVTDSADAEQADAASTGFQMNFDFNAEVRTQELATFSERTSAAASKMTGQQQQTYIEASQQIAASFEMSMSVSGQVLSGFANGSDKLEGADPGVVNKFLGLAKDTLKDFNDIANQIFELLDGFFSGQTKSGSKDALGKSLDKLINEIYSAFFGQGAVSSGKLAGTPGVGDGAGGGAKTSATSMGIQLEFKFEFSAKIEVKTAEVQESDPITLDLNGNGMQLSSYLKGARFDIAGSGQAVNTAFVNGGDAFLALDRNANGIVDSGKELFGDQNGAANGYEELAKLDSNGDKLINKLDKDFAKLLLFKDNGNGRTEPGELVSLAKAGIVELNLKYSNVSMTADGGNRIGQLATYRRADGSTGQTADTILNYTA